LVLSLGGFFYFGFFFTSAGRIYRTGQRLSGEEPAEASLMASDAETDIFNFAFFDFIRHLRVREKCASDPHHIDVVICDGSFRQIRVMKFARAYDGDHFGVFLLAFFIVPKSESERRSGQNLSCPLLLVLRRIFLKETQMKFPRYLLFYRVLRPASGFS
jgi:hypothetical protein